MEKQLVMDDFPIIPVHAVEIHFGAIRGSGGEPNHIATDHRCAVAFILQRRLPSNALMSCLIPFERELASVGVSDHAIKSRALLVWPEDRRRGRLSQKRTREEQSEKKGRRLHKRRSKRTRDDDGFCSRGKIDDGFRHKKTRRLVLTSTAR